MIVAVSDKLILYNIAHENYQLPHNRDSAWLAVIQETSNTTTTTQTDQQTDFCMHHILHCPHSVLQSHMCDYTLKHFTGTDPSVMLYYVAFPGQNVFKKVTGHLVTSH